MKNFIYDLQERYAKNNLDFSKAILVWKEAKLNSNQIREAIKQDCRVEVTDLQAQDLFHQSSLIKAEKFSFTNPQEQKMAERLKTSKLIRFTPTVRASIDKIGPNTYRSKYGQIEWSIQMVDGEPHLARREILEQETHLEKTASPISKGRFGVTVDLSNPSSDPMENLTGGSMEDDPGVLSVDASPMNDILAGRAGNDTEQIINYLVANYNMGIEEAEQIYVEALPYIS